MKLVYSVTWRNRKRFLTRIGAAFVNNDGSLSVRLEALPVNGEMLIRDMTAGEQERRAKRPDGDDDAT